MPIHNIFIQTTKILLKSIKAYHQFYQDCREGQKSQVFSKDQTLSSISAS